MDRNGPARYHLAVQAAGAMADILPDLMLDTYAQAVLDGLAREEAQKGGLLPGLGFVRCFDRALSSVLGDLDDRGDGFHEAWQAVLLLHSILPGELAAFATCMLDALHQGGGGLGQPEEVLETVAR
ncbi:hypothetical protein GCM10010505_06320 [Kitasatospora aburaviensis]